MLLLARQKSTFNLHGEDVGRIRREVLRYAMMLEETLSYIRDYRSQPNFHLVLCMCAVCLSW